MSHAGDQGHDLWSRRAFRRRPPTEPIPVPDLLRRSPYRVVREHPRPRKGGLAGDIQAALDLATRIGELMLRSGAGAPQVEASVAAVAHAGGLAHFEVDITLQALLVQARSDDGQTHTQLRVVRHARPDHARLVAVHRLVDELAHGDLDIGSAAATLRSIKSRPHSFAPWMLRCARSTLAAAVAAMIGASVSTTVVTFGVVLVVSPVVTWTSRWRLPDFYQSALVAFASTLLAWLAYVMGVQGWLDVGERGFAFIVAGGIVALLPGRAMASAVEDVLSAYAVTGAGRLLSVVVSLLGLIIGIALALSFTARLTGALGFAFVSPAVLDLRVDSGSVAAALVGAAVVGASGAITLQSRRHLILLCGALGLLGAAVNALAIRSVGIGPVTATGVAAVTIGLVGRLVAQRLRAPSLVVVVPASFGLLPGLTIFRGLYEMVGQADPGTLSLQSGLTTLFTAGAVLLAIATGTTFGEILGSPWDDVLRGAGRRIRR